jgi:DNA ligase-1
MITKPLLACNIDDVNNIKFPVLATPKLDGIRCLKINGKVLSRKFIDIPNDYIRNKLLTLPDGLDGEIICPNKTFNETQSLVMSKDGEPDFTYVIFDYVTDINRPYYARVSDMLSRFTTNPIHKNESWIQTLIPKQINNVTELNMYEQWCQDNNYEGVMIRQPNSLYKCGRSTLREGILIKIKQFQDSEAKVIDFTEMMSNDNEAVTDNLGNTKRSSNKENLVPTGKLGSIKVQDINSGIVFEIGTGFNDELRTMIWNNKNTYVNKLITYTYQPSGMKDKPRFPVFKGFRNEIDL